MDPYHQLNLTTRNRIIGLIKQCEVSNLGNVSFEYYPSPGEEGKSFHMAQNNSGWELVVIAKDSRTRDIYEIVGDQIIYEYSEKD